MQPIMVKECVRCPRCGGLGYIVNCLHVKQGQCFRCAGERVVFEWKPIVLANEGYRSARDLTGGHRYN